MIRGALILAVGYALGYTHAMAQVPEAREFLEALKKEWAQSSDAENDTADTADEADEDEAVKADPTYHRTGKSGKPPKGETSQ